MGLFNKLQSLVFLQRSAQTGTSITPPASSTSPASSSVPTSTSAQKSLEELEREIMAQYAPTQRMKSAVPRRRKGIGSKLIGTTLLFGIPLGALWVVNLPYPPIRRPIARTAPILLLPSYISMDNSYREAVSLVEQAKQLIDGATSPADLDLGAQKVEQAQANLDKLPIWLWDELPGTNYWWYSWRFSYGGFNAARGDIGRLQAKAFQERNAQTALVNAEQALTTAKQQYQQAGTPANQQAAIGAWQAALDQIQQVPGGTLAGRSAQQKLAAYQRDFEAIVGFAAGNQQRATLIKAAQQYAMQAAKMGQNPPHSVEQWQQIGTLWQQAIQGLGQIPPDDLASYAEAQKLRAQYQANLGEIQVRQQVEAEAVQFFQNAQQKITALQASTPNDPKQIDRNYTISQLHSIINDLNQVKNGTTVYKEAQTLLIYANNRLNQLQPKSR